MTANKDQAQYEQDQVHNDAAQKEIADILKSDGPQYCGHVANKMGKHPKEVRWHLEEMRKRGDIEYNWISKRYSV